MSGTGDCYGCAYLDIKHDADSYGYCDKYKKYVVLIGDQAEDRGRFMDE